jgi:hypothetical protein
MTNQNTWGILRYKVKNHDGKGVWDGWYFDKKDAEEVAELFKEKYPNEKVLLIKKTKEIENADA